MGSTTIEELCAVEAIRQLVSRYALAVDVRDLDLLVECFVPDVQVGRSSFGREALRSWFDDTLRRFGYTIHLVGNHVIELVDADHAKGVVYCRAEHEQGDEFVVATVQYWDEYERVDSEWYFRRRRELPWYAVDALQRPIGTDRVRWPDSPQHPAELPNWWPSWGAFTGSDPEKNAASSVAADFLQRLRLGSVS